MYALSFASNKTQNCFNKTKRDSFSAGGLAVRSPDEHGNNGGINSYLPCSFTIKLPKKHKEHGNSCCKSIFHSLLFGLFALIFVRLIWIRLATPPNKRNERDKKLRKKKCISHRNAKWNTYTLRAMTNARDRTQSIAFHSRRDDIIVALMWVKKKKQKISKKMIEMTMMIIKSGKCSRKITISGVRSLMQIVWMCACAIFQRR